MRIIVMRCDTFGPGFESGTFVPTLVTGATTTGSFGMFRTARPAESLRRLFSSRFFVSTATSSGPGGLPQPKFHCWHGGHDPPPKTQNSGQAPVVRTYSSFFAPIGYCSPPNPYREWLMCALFLGLSLCCGWAVVSAESQSGATSDVASPRQRVFADIADGNLDEHDLFTAAIIISGANTHAEIERYQQQIEKLIAKSRTTESAQNDATLGFMMLQMLHAELLTGNYDPGCGDLRRAFQYGDFNCATATILFQVLARQHGVRSVAVGLPGHVRSRIGDASLETTSASGRRPENSVDGAIDASTRVRDLTDVQLLAKLLYNQGLQHLSSSRYSQALVTTELSWQLDRDHDEARQNVAAVVNNWALRLSSPGTYGQALDLLRRGQEVAPDNGTLALNERQVLMAWWAQATADRDMELARRIRETASKRHPGLRLE